MPDIPVKIDADSDLVAMDSGCQCVFYLMIDTCHLMPSPVEPYSAAVECRIVPRLPAGPGLCHVVCHEVYLVHILLDPGIELQDPAPFQCRNGDEGSFPAPGAEGGEVPVK